MRFPSQTSARFVEPWVWTYVLISLTTTGIVPILVPLEVIKVEGSALHVGLVMSSIGAGMLSAPIWGALVERWHLYREVVMGGSLAISLALVGFIRADRLFEWILLAFLIGCGVSASFTVSNLLIVGRHPKAEWDARIAMLQTFVSVGTVAGLMVAGGVSHLPLRMGFRIGILTTSLACLIAWLAIPVPESVPRNSIVEEPTASVTESWHFTPQQTRRWPAQSMLQSILGKVSVPFSFFLGAWLVSNLGMFGLNALYPLVVNQEFGVPASTASFVLASATTLSALLFHRVSLMTARVGARRVLQGGLFLRAIGLTAISCLAIFAFSDRSVLALGLFAAITMTWPLLSVSSTLLASQLSGGRGTSMGFYNATNAVASLGGPVLAGNLADSMGYASTWLFALGGVLLGLAFAFGISRSESS